MNVVIIYQCFKTVSSIRDIFGDFLLSDDGNSEQINFTWLNRSSFVAVAQFLLKYLFPNSRHETSAVLQLHLFLKCGGAVLQTEKAETNSKLIQN